MHTGVRVARVSTTNRQPPPPSHPPARREQDGPYFGSLIINKEYVGEAVPTITANQNESHQAFREHAMGAFRSRIPHAQTAMTHATDTFYENLWENGEQ